MFRPLALAFDIATAIVILAAFTALVEWRRRWRRLYQFTLRELLVGTAFCAAGLACWIRARNAENRISEHLNAINANVADPLFVQTVSWVPRFPRWIRDLVGDKRLLTSE
jgi:hypothetical protein